MESAKRQGRRTLILRRRALFWEVTTLGRQETKANDDDYDDYDDYDDEYDDDKELHFFFFKQIIKLYSGGLL